MNLNRDVIFVLHYWGIGDGIRLDNQNRRSVQGIAHMALKNIR
jgi:hypothetical protein